MFTERKSNKEVLEMIKTQNNLDLSEDGEDCLEVSEHYDDKYFEVISYKLINSNEREVKGYVVYNIKHLDRVYSDLEHFVYNYYDEERVYERVGLSRDMSKNDVINYCILNHSIYSIISTIHDIHTTKISLLGDWIVVDKYMYVKKTY